MSVTKFTRQCVQREIRALTKNPVDHIRAKPNDNNILEVNYVIEGPEDSPYAGGFYHGVVRAPHASMRRRGTPTHSRDRGGVACAAEATKGVPDEAPCDQDVDA